MSDFLEMTTVTRGTCSRRISFKVKYDKTVWDIAFEGGCNGNLKGIAALCEGMSAYDIIKRCEGIKCGFKNTSCPDQLAEALKTALLEIDTDEYNQTYS